jgi:hypothetical protein
MTPGERAIWAELTRIRELLERLPSTAVPPRQARLTGAEGATVQRLFMAAHASFGNGSFVTADLLARCAFDPALREAVAKSGLNPRQLGKLFARASGVEYGGWSIDAKGMDGNRVVWRVSRSFQTPETPSHAGAEDECAIGLPQLTSD